MYIEYAIVGIYAFFNLKLHIQNQTTASNFIQIPNNKSTEMYFHP